MPPLAPALKAGLPVGLRVTLNRRSCVDSARERDGPAGGVGVDLVRRDGREADFGSELAVADLKASMRRAATPGGWL